MTYEKQILNLTQRVFTLEAKVEALTPKPTPSPRESCADCGCVCGRCSHRGGASDHDAGCEEAVLGPSPRESGEGEASGAVHVMVRRFTAHGCGGWQDEKGEFVKPICDTFTRESGEQLCPTCARPWSERCCSDAFHLPRESGEGEPAPVTAGEGYQATVRALSTLIDGVEEFFERTRPDAGALLEACASSPKGQVAALVEALWAAADDVVEAEADRCALAERVRAKCIGAIEALSCGDGPEAHTRARASLAVRYFDLTPLLTPPEEKKP